MRLYQVHAKYECALKFLDGLGMGDVGERERRGCDLGLILCCAVEIGVPEKRDH